MPRWYTRPKTVTRPGTNTAHQRLRNYTPCKFTIGTNTDTDTESHGRPDAKKILSHETVIPPVKL